MNNIDNINIHVTLTLAQINVILQTLDLNVPHGTARPIVDAMRNQAMEQLQAAEQAAQDKPEPKSEPETVGVDTGSSPAPTPVRNVKPPKKAH